MRKTAVGLLATTASGILFGLITVGAKAVHAPPLAKASVSAAAACLAAAWSLRDFRPERHDWGKLAGMVVAGGIVAPVAILHGLRSVTASHAGVILTAELVVTALLGYLFLHERHGLRALSGFVALFTAALLVGLASGLSGHSSAWGLALVALAAIAFAADNSLAGSLVGAYRPAQLIAAKNLMAFPVLAAAWAFLEPTWPAGALDWALLAAIGAIGVGGANILLFYAIQQLGSGRAVAVNVPLSGLAAAGLGFLLLHEGLGWLDGGAAFLLALGLGLLWEPKEGAKNAPRRRGRGAKRS